MVIRGKPKLYGEIGKGRGISMRRTIHDYVFTIPLAVYRGMLTLTVTISIDSGKLGIDRVLG